MPKKSPYHFDIRIHTDYVEEASFPDESHFVFNYSVAIKNGGTKPAKIVNRHWYLTNGDGEVEEIERNQSLGFAPRLLPGQEVQHKSNINLTTPVGTVHGVYTLAADDGNEFELMIPAFRLAIPHFLH